MIDGERVGAVLVAAGRSTRMGFDKLWTVLGDRPVLAWSLAILGGCSEIDRLVVVTAPDRQDETIDLVGHSFNLTGYALLTKLRTSVVLGGERRRDSVEAGVRALDDCRWVLVHDAARPFLSGTILEQGLREVVTTGACVPGVPARDTIKRVQDGTVVETLPRDQLWMIQTPQFFRRDLVLSALAATDDDATDEAALVERAGGTVRIVPGDLRNFKITTPLDLEIAQSLVGRTSKRAN